MGAGGFGHLAEAEVQAFRQQHGQQSDPVSARCSGAYMGEGFREACGIVHLQKQIGDPHIGQPFV